MSNIDLSALITAETKEANARRAALRALADLRWRVETGGITWKGQPMPTSREAQSQYANAAALVQAKLSVGDVSWKTETGWRVLSPEDRTELAAQVHRHVSACFEAEKRVSAELEVSRNLASLDLNALFDTALKTSETNAADSI